MLRPVVINRDLYGRIRLVLDAAWESQPGAEEILTRFANEVVEKLGAHTCDADELFLYVEGLEQWREQQDVFPLEGDPAVWIADRWALEPNWAVISPSAPMPRIVFYSVNGGVGRSTALAATAWALAKQGKNVLVLDLDLESPGLSSSLLSEDQQPMFGVTDWLVEDLVDQGDLILREMAGLSSLSSNGDVRVVPAHGADPGEYLSKLGRVYMSKTSDVGLVEPWFRRLVRLVLALEARYQPDVTLIDSRSGLDEIASACVTEIPNSRVLLFALDGPQTWVGLRALFRHWQKRGVARSIRERLQVVGAMIPEVGGPEYFQSLLETAWATFTEELYDEVPAGEIPGEDVETWDMNEQGPHYPLPIRWNRSFMSLRSLEDPFGSLDQEVIKLVFGGLVNPLIQLLQDGG